MRALNLTRRQWLTVFLLFVGYSGYYVCRSNFAVVKSSLITEFGAFGINKISLGAIGSIGTILYTIGKLSNGILCDLLGGRRLFIFGMLGSVFCTLLFGFGPQLFGFGAVYTLFLVAWGLNRYVQSVGWAALVKVAANWFPFALYGRIMGILSLSFLLGDAIAKLFLGKLLNMGFGWRGVYLSSAVTLGIIALMNILFLRASPKEVGEPEPDSNPANLFSEDEEKERSQNVLTLLMPFLLNSTFWLVAILSFGLTLIRETFGEWLPLYLKEVGRLSEGDAAYRASLFPFFGAISALLVGYMADRVFKGRRGAVMAIALLLSVIPLTAMSIIKSGQESLLPTILAALVAFLVIGPYSFLAGAIAMDLGGKRGSSTASGLIDGAGYLGGTFSGYFIGVLAEKQGWGVAFGALAVCSALTAVAAFIYWGQEQRRLAAASA